MDEATKASWLKRRIDALNRSRSFRDESGSYNVVRFMFDPSGVGVSKSEQAYPIPGDTIFCAEKNGSAPVYLKLGFENNPWINLQRGRTYKRKFNRFKLAVFNDPYFVPSYGGAVTQEPQSIVDCTLYVSHGELVGASEEDEGLDGTAFFGEFEASTIVGPLVPDSLSPPSYTRFCTYGKHGGLLTLQNTDLSNRLYLGNSEVSGTRAEGFPLEAGASYTCKLNSRVGGPASGPGDPQARRLLVWTTSGTCKYAVIISPMEMDNTDPYFGRQQAL
jgi:hypothetical protein